MDAPVASYKFRAFISYSHKDRDWAARIQKRIENYRVPRELVGRKTPLGTVPERLYPIFRDRTDASAGLTLTDGLARNLDASQSLILICSPNSAASDTVAREIVHFKFSGRGDRILPIIVGGDPAAKFQVDDCFPKALRMKVHDGVIGDTEESIPIAADVRAQGDREELAVLKVIAGMTGIGLGELMQRNREAEIRERRRWYMISATMLVLFLAAGGAAALAWTTSTKNAKMLQEVLSGSIRLVGEAVRANKERGMPVGETINFVTTASDMIQAVRKVGNSSDTVMREIANFEMTLADGYNKVNKIDDQASHAQVALRLMQSLIRGNPQDPLFLRDLARAYWAVGYSITVVGKNADALPYFEDCLVKTASLSDETLLSDPRLTSIVTTCHRQVAFIDMERGRFSEAAEHVRQSLALAKTALEKNFNTGSLEDVAWSYIHLGDLLRRQQNYDEAGKAVSEALQLLDEVKDKHKELVLPVQRFQGKLYIVKGDTSLFQAARAIDKVPLYERAREDFRVSARLLGMLSKLDESNVVYTNDLAFSLIKIAETSTRLREYDVAKAAYEKAKEAVEKHLQHSPDNFTLRRTLTLSLAGLSDVLTMLLQREEAIRYALMRIENDKVALKADQDSVQRERDYADGHYYVARMYEANNQPEKAVPHDAEALVIYARHAEQKPTNIDFQFQHSRSLEAKGGIHMKLGQKELALELMQLARPQRQKVVELATAAKRPPTQVLQHRRNLANTHGLLARALLANGKCGEALAAFAEADAGYAKVLEENEKNKDWQKQQADWAAEHAAAKVTCAAPSEIKVNAEP
jgi:tetratricopeptide (TPR) repeat protein